MTLTARDKRLLAVLVVVAILGGYWMLVFKPLNGKVGELDQQISSKESTLQSLEQRIASYRAAQATYAADYSSVAQLGAAVPKDDAIPSLLVQLDRLAGENISFTQVEVREYPQPALQPSITGQFGDPLGASTQLVGNDQSSGGLSEEPASGSTSTGKSKKTSSSAGSPTTGLPFQPIQVRLQFEGNFFKLQKLLAGMDRMVQVANDRVSVGGRLVLVEGLKLEDGRLGFPQVKVGVAIVVFSQLGTPATGGGSESLPAGSPPSSKQAPPAGSAATPAASVSVGSP